MRQTIHFEQAKRAKPAFQRLVKVVDLIVLFA